MRRHRKSRDHHGHSLLAIFFVSLLVMAVVFFPFYAYNKIKNHGINNRLGTFSASVSSRKDSFSERPVTEYYWPSVEEGGLLGKIHSIQNPEDCSKPSTKFLVWQSLKNNEKDTRGLSAWAHAGSNHLLHALTDGDHFNEAGSRVLINDDKLWPMAKGCLNGPETRECYFEPLTKCKLSDADNQFANNSETLKRNKDEYNRETRTVYLTESDPWPRQTRNKYSFTGLPGNQVHSEIDMTAALIAYYFQPKEWLKIEINRRLKESIPSDLNPMHTAGVPIRRSDKCNGHSLEGSAAGELDCPSLDMYLNGIRSLLAFDPLIKNVIVTSEDKAACEEFLVMVKREFPELRVVQNVGDVQQGTGSGTMVEAYVEGAANADVVASAMTSLHLHLRARYFVITSKSTWTSTIAVFARVYGLASQIFVIDIGPNNNFFSSYARKGCV